MPPDAKLIRKKLMRGLHAEAAKRGIAHDDLRSIAGVDSLGKASNAQLGRAFEQLCGRPFLARHPGIRDRRRRKAAGNAGHKSYESNLVELASADDLLMIRQAADRLGWGPQTLEKFTSRQLKGRSEIRTLADVNKVFQPIKRMLHRSPP